MEPLSIGAASGGNKLLDIGLFRKDGNKRHLLDVNILGLGVKLFGFEDKAKPATTPAQIKAIPQAPTSHKGAPGPSAAIRHYPTLPAAKAKPKATAGPDVTKLNTAVSNAFRDVQSGSPKDKGYWHKVEEFNLLRARYRELSGNSGAYRTQQDPKTGAIGAKPAKA